MIEKINADFLILEKKKRERLTLCKDKKRKKNDKKSENPKVISKKKRKMNESISIDSDKSESNMESSLNLSKISENVNNGSMINNGEMDDAIDSINLSKSEIQINRDVNNISLSIQLTDNVNNQENTDLGKKVI